MSFLSDNLGSEGFQLGDWWNKLKKNPEQLLIGAADPLGAKVWSGITGKKYEPFVDQMGGPYGGHVISAFGANDGGVYGRAREAGINTGPATNMHDAAHVVSALYGGAGLSNAAGGLFSGPQAITSNQAAVLNLPESSATLSNSASGLPGWMKAAWQKGSDMGGLSGSQNMPSFMKNFWAKGNNMGGLFSGPQMPTQGLMGQQQADPQADQRMAMAAQLLAGSGYSSQKQGFGQILGQALQAGQQARMAAQQQQMHQAVQQAQLENLQAKTAQTKRGQDLFGNITPDKFTPESLAEFQQTGNYGVLRIRPQEEFGHVNPGEFTPESLAKYAQTHDYNDLVRIWAPPAPSVKDVGNVPTLVTPGMSVAGGIRGPSGGASVTPLSTLQGEAAGKATVEGAAASATAAGKVKGEAGAQAQVDLPKTLGTAEQSIQTLDQLISHPGLPYITGVASKVPIVPGTDQAAADALAKQVEGQAFLQAYQSLKGAGAITEGEGKAATAAIGRLQRAQSTQDYISAAKDLRKVIANGAERVRAAAARASSLPGAAPPANRPPLESFGKP